MIATIEKNHEANCDVQRQVVAENGNVGIQSPRQFTQALAHGWPTAGACCEYMLSAADVGGLTYIHLAPYSNPRRTHAWAYNSSQSADSPEWMQITADIIYLFILIFIQLEMWIAAAIHISSWMKMTLWKIQAW